MIESQSNKVKPRALIGWATWSVRRRGFIETARIAFDFIVDMAFDWRYGTETRRWVDVEALETASENKSRSVQYQATKAPSFLRLLHRLGLPEDSVFVDLGSGKGRALLLASQFRFKRVVGVEFCANLCAHARKNIEIFRKHNPRASEIEVVESDVTRHEFKGDESVFYLYHPFDAVVLGQVLENIGRSLKVRPRQIWLIYNTPEHREVIEQAGLFGKSRIYHIGASEFSVYTNAASARVLSLNCLWPAVAVSNSFAAAIAFG